MSVIARAPDGTIRLFCKGSDAKVRGAGGSRLGLARPRHRMAHLPLQPAQSILQASLCSLLARCPPPRRRC